MTWLLSLFARWSGPEALRKPLGYLTAAIAALALLWLLWAAFGLWLHFHDRSVIREYERKVQEQVEAIREDADAAGREAAETSAAESSAEIEAAREAAAGDPSDPWRAAICRMRGGC